MNNVMTLTEKIISLKQENNSGIIFSDSSTQECFISYANLFNLSRSLLSDMQKTDLEIGDEIVFQISDNKKFIVTFWACILGGYIPVPVAIGDNTDHKEKLIKILKQMRRPKLVTDIDIEKKISGIIGNIDEEFWQALIHNSLTISHLNLSFIDPDPTGVIFKPSSSDTALVQFSSGSTGQPKGVVLTHNNLITNIEDMIEASGVNESDSSLSWMPLTHDMGLIAFHLASLYAGINQYLMPTNSFVRSPINWFKLVSKYRITQLFLPTLD